MATKTKPTFTQEPAGPLKPERRRALGWNVINRYQHTTANEPHLATLGAQFFPHWREDAEFLAHKADISVPHAAAGMARLSPQTGAELNRLMSYQSLHLTDDQMKHVHLAGEHALAAQGLSSRITAIRKRGEDVDPALMREYDARKAAATFHRKKANLEKTPLNMQSMSAVSAALRNFAGEHEDPLSIHNLGRVKIHDFANAIHDHSWPGQTIDTHYHDAMHGRIDIPYETDRGLGKIGQYTKHQEVADWAYGHAVKLGIVDPAHTTPAQFMGSTWMGHIQEKVLGNVDANKSRRSETTRVGNFLGGASAHLYDPAHFGQRPIALHFRV